MQYKNYKEFINYLKSLPNDQTVLDAVFQYFIDNVEYAYEHLKLYKLRKGIMEKKHDELLSSLDVLNIKQINATIDKLQPIYALEDNTIIVLKKQAKNCSEFLDHDNIHPDDKFELLINAATVAIAHKDIKVKINNGLIARGVCANYASFINKVCFDLGIESYSINGISTKGIGHAWNRIVIDGDSKYYDITYEIFDRDKLGKQYKKGSWLGVTFEELKVRQPDRHINSEHWNKVSSDSVAPSDE